MPSNTVFDPKNSTDYDKSKMIFNSQGVIASCTLNSTTNLDLSLADDHLISGFWLVGTGVTFGDKIDLQIIDPNNQLGFGANAVIKQLATNIYLPTGAFSADFDVAYSSKIFAGLTIRVVYHSCALLGALPNFAINYKLHKVLI